MTFSSRTKNRYLTFSSSVGRSVHLYFVMMAPVTLQAKKILKYLYRKGYLNIESITLIEALDNKHFIVGVQFDSFEELRKLRTVFNLLGFEWMNLQYMKEFFEEQKPQLYFGYRGNKLNLIFEGLMGRRNQTLTVFVPVKFSTMKQSLKRMRKVGFEIYDCFGPKVFSEDSSSVPSPEVKERR